MRTITNHRKKATFTILSACAALVQIIMYVAIVIYYSDTFGIGGANKQPGLLINILYPTLMIVGIVLTYLSFKKPENLHFLRWLAACLNVFFVLIYGASLIFIIAKIIG